MTQRSIKRIALITMIIDHIGAHIPGLPIWFRYIGRISAPLFVFCCVHSLENTKSKRRFVIRLYLASLIMSLGNILVHLILGGNGFIPSNNMFLTMFIGSIAVIVIQKWKTKGLAIFCIYQCVLCFIYIMIDYIPHFRGLPYKYFDYLFPTITGLAYTTEYGVTFVLLFVLMFYMKDNPMLLSALMLLCAYGQYKVSHRVNPVMIDNILGCWKMQYLMLFSLPIMLLYNGNKGKGSKYFYYIFYPLHVWILIILENTCF